MATCLPPCAMCPPTFAGRTLSALGTENKDGVRVWAKGFEEPRNDSQGYVAIAGSMFVRTHTDGTADVTYVPNDSTVCVQSSAVASG